ncbi:MAG: aminotransferase class I/II-fold pyridoxal phosphate-dependent enzyme [Cytophagaceae bacterium]
MEKLISKLKQREEEGNLRRLTARVGLIDFFSNDYLGLAKSAELADAIHNEFCKVKGNLNGSTGSRLLSGNNDYVQQLEQKLSKLFNAESALIFNSGYNANLSILSAVPQKDDTILYDELIHASLKEGARLSFAQRFSFRHNDPDDLEKKIKKSKGDVFIVVESIYSMDGDKVPLQDFITIAEKYGAHIILDEAHSTGLLGKHGNGMACELGVEDKIFARVYTFGKAMGIHGACIAGSKVLSDYLINFARPFIYTTSLPPHSLIAIDKAFEYIRANAQLSERIKEKIKLFKTCASDELKQILLDSDSPIQVLRIEGNTRAKSAAARLTERGFDVRAILSPTVKQGEERLRICLHLFNTDEEIIDLVNCIKEVL